MLLSIKFGTIEKMERTLILKSMFILLLMVSCSYTVFAFDFRTIFNPFTQKLDYYTGSNFTGQNITADYYYGDGRYMSGLESLINNGTANNTFNESRTNQLYLPLRGGNVTGNINMSGKNITYVDNLLIVDPSQVASLENDAPLAALHIRTKANTEPGILTAWTPMDWVFPLKESLQIGHINVTSKEFFERLRINTVGRVGINTKNPKAQLDVNGTIISTAMNATTVNASYFYGKINYTYIQNAPWLTVSSDTYNTSSDILTVASVFNETVWVIAQNYLSAYSEIDPLWSANYTNVFTAISSNNLTDSDIAGMGYIKTDTYNTTSQIRLACSVYNESTWVTNQNYLTSYIETDPLWSGNRTAILNAIASNNLTDADIAAMGYIKTYTDTYNTSNQILAVTGGINTYNTSAQILSVTGGVNTFNTTSQILAVTGGVNTFNTSAQMRSAANSTKNILNYTNILYNNYIPYTGATKKVSLGTRNLSVNGLAVGTTEQVFPAEIVNIPGTLLSIRANSVAVSTQAILRFTTSTSSNPTHHRGEIRVNRTDVGGSGATDMMFYTSTGSSLTPKVTIKANGYTGIGTASPSYNLHVIGKTYSSGNISSGGYVCDSTGKCIHNVNTYNTSIQIKNVCSVYNETTWVQSQGYLTSNSDTFNTTSQMVSAVVGTQTNTRLCIWNSGTSKIDCDTLGAADGYNTSAQMISATASQYFNSTDAATFVTLNTGYGANELYDMNQHVQTTDSVKFVNVTGTTQLYSGGTIVNGSGIYFK